MNMPKGVEIRAPQKPGFDSILTSDALALVAKLHREFNGRRQELLARRVERVKRLDAGEKPDFLAETRNIRDGSWKIAPIPKDLQCRRVEITGPVERKMIINALNSGADAYMTDFEDSNTPNWDNQITGQINLIDAVRRRITLEQGGKTYKLNDKIATLVVRPRGWHLDEKHVYVDGSRVSGGVFDFALFMFHNAKELIARGSGPYFYLPKMESHLEARLWNEIFVMTQKELGIPQGTVKATVLIETILAAFEMDEAYGHVGMRIQQPADVRPALEEAFSLKDRTVFMDFLTDPAENVYPMIEAGKGHHEMHLSPERELA